MLCNELIVMIVQNVIVAFAVKKCGNGASGNIAFRGGVCMIKIAIVEDSEEDAQTLADYCGRYAQEKGKDSNVRIFNNGYDFISSDKLDYDIIMLDIKMPYMNGLQTAQKIRESNENVCIVFITNMQQYAIHGYSVSASDFIIKPVKYSLFSFKFDRLLTKIDRGRDQSIVIKTNRAMKYLQLSDIVYIETQKHKLVYHTLSGDYEVWGSMKDTCDTITRGDFALCNSGCYVNLKYVEEVNNYTVTVNGTPLVISRLKYKSFLDALTNYSCRKFVLNSGKMSGD